MTDENPLHSGSRWEPAAHPTPTPREPAEAGTPDTPDTVTSGSTPTAPGPSRPAGARRGILAAAVVGLVAAGGLGGLAFGHVAADEGSGQPGQVSQLRTTDDHPAFPGGSTLPPGTLPGQAPHGDIDGDGGTGSDDQGGGSGDGSGTTQPGSPT